MGAYVKLPIALEFVHYSVGIRLVSVLIS